MDSYLQSQKSATLNKDFQILPKIMFWFCLYDVCLEIKALWPPGTKINQILLSLNHPFWEMSLDKNVCHWLLNAGLTIWQIVVNFNEKCPLAFTRLFKPFFICMHVLLINYTADFPGTSLNCGDKSHLTWNCSVSTDVLHQRSWP